MEKINYYEAREWFWVRTVVWLVPCAIVSVMACFLLSSGLFTQFWQRVWLALGVGVVASLLGLGAAGVSLSSPWMKGGWRLSFVLNAPVCAGAAGVAAFLLGGLALSFLQTGDLNPITQPAAFAAQARLIDSAYKMMQLGIAVSGLWGFIFGSWFALRRDRYFVELV